MDRLYPDLEKKQYTDVEIVLIDQSNSLKIDCHKVVLGHYSDFFHRLFTFHNEKKSFYEIMVGDVKIAHDIILSFYGQKINSTSYPDWEYILKTFKCRDYFCINNDLALLYNLIVPTKGFELLLEVINLFDFIKDEKLMNTIKKNIPNDYDLKKFSIDFIHELLKIKNYYITCCVYTIVKIIDVVTGQILFTLNGHNDSVISVSFSPDNLKIVSGSKDGTIELWDAITGQLLSTLKGHSKCVFCTAFSPDNLKIVSGGKDNMIKVWDTNSGQLLSTLNGHTDRIYTVSFSPDNLKIVSGGKDNTIKVWDANTGQLLSTLKGHNDAVTSIAFSSDNLKIVSSSADFTIKIWNVVTGHLISTLNAHDGWVYNVAFSPDNLKIVSSGTDSPMKIWDAASGQLSNTINVHNCLVYNVAFSADNLKIVSSGSDNTTNIWDVVTGQLFTLNTDIIPIRGLAISNNIYAEIDKKLINYLNSIS